MIAEEGELVRLREKTIKDAPDDYGWRCDAELARFDAALPLRIPYRHFLTEYEIELNNSGTYRRRYAIDTLTDEHIGNCTYFNIDQIKKETEFGIIIGKKKYWNAGYGREATDLLLRHIFKTTDLQRVYLYTLDWNLRAQACFRRCGFREIRRATEGMYHFVVMEIHRDEFERLDSEAV